MPVDQPLQRAAMRPDDPLAMNADARDELDSDTHELVVNYVPQCVGMLWAKRCGTSHRCKS